ncbi:MAG TPA: PIN domain-containing protein [Casimicrobiaceae bacterium]|nr:PIN domain-containing protein [Casimicrobiaceae bacterium]
MTAAVFVDTNVFVYARDVRETLKQPRATSWLEHLWRRQLGRTSVQVLVEYYATVTRKLDPGLPPAVAWDDLSHLMAWRPQPSDEALLKRGRDIELRYRLSWWDSLIVAAAQLQGCALLLSEDLQDGGDYGGVTVRNPFKLEVGEPAATYAVSAVPTRRHPSRGRPKRVTAALR